MEQTDKTDLTREERINFLELVLCEPLWYIKVDLILEYHELKKAIFPYWTIEKTAHKIGRSIPSLNRDLKLARALRINPDLKNCKGREDAEKSVGGGA